MDQGGGELSLLSLEREMGSSCVGCCRETERKLRERRKKGMEEIEGEQEESQQKEK
jgi:hypothetical protein